MALISVLVVNFNACDALGDTLQSLTQQTRGADEVILVDNASADGSVAFVKDHFPSVQVIESATNAGFSAGNNVGAAAARGDYLALLNSDAVADPNWLAELAAVLDA